ncbi:hypothetical protein M758_9G048400 [Ceratodon purpureus]|nr:hypothetical protein M758_9G048400 [Ceratodon purpureus]
MFGSDVHRPRNAIAIAISAAPLQRAIAAALRTILHARPAHRLPCIALFPTSSFLLHSLLNSASGNPSFALLCFLLAFPLNSGGRQDIARSLRRSGFDFTGDGVCSG